MKLINCLIKMVLIVVPLFILSCNAQGLSSEEKMFEKHVVGSLYQINKLHFFKDKSAMHGPMFFRFSVSNSEMIQQEIVEKHNLKKTSKVPDGLEAINHLATKNVDWWKSLSDLKKLSFYSISFVPRSGVGDFHLRCLFVNSTEMYFVTTGFFPTDKFKVETVQE